MRWPRRVASGLSLALLLALPPVVLVEVVGWPIHGWPDTRQVRQGVAQPLTEQTLTAALTLLAWLVWLVLAVTVTVRVTVRLRAGARWLRRVPLPTPLQATATGMAGAAAFSAGAHAGSAGTPPENPLAVAAGTLDHTTDTPSQRRDVPDVNDADGVLVAGGWLPREIAEQVAAAAALVWLRRRRTYQPHPPDTQARDDADLAPLPTTVTAVQAALAAPSTHAPVSPAVTEAASPWLPAPVAALPPGGVALTGPGALAAARGILLTAVLAGLRHPAAAVPLVVTRTALTMLLGEAWERLPGVRVADTADDAEGFLAPAADGRQGSSAPGREHAPTAPTRPVLILETAPVAGRLRAALAAGAGTAVMLGAGTGEVTWHVDAAGHTHDPRHPAQAGPRLCVLDPVATIDLLTVIVQAHPPLEAHPDPVSRPVTVATPRQPRIPRQATDEPTRGRPTSQAATTTVRRLDLRVLGEPALLVDGTPVRIRRSAALQVLVFLAVHRAGASSEQLVEAIWPGMPAHRLTGRLYTTLSDLRSTVRSACGLTVIDHTDNRFRLNPTHLDADLWRLHALAEQAATAVTSPATAWQKVVDAYTGDLAGAHTWPWLDPAREATRRPVLDAYAALAAAQPDPRRALGLLEAGIRVDPYNQALQQRAIGILTALGDHDAAVELSHSYTRRLTAAGLPPADVRASRDDAEPVSGR